MGTRKVTDLLAALDLAATCIALTVLHLIPRRADRTESEFWEYDVMC